MYSENMETFNTATDNLLEITPELIAKDWTLGLQKNIADVIVERIQWRTGWRGLSESETQHISGVLTRGIETGPCPIAQVRNVVEGVDDDYDWDAFGPAKNQVSAEVTCTCGEVANVRVRTAFDAGDFIATFATL